MFSKKQKSIFSDLVDQRLPKRHDTPTGSYIDWYQRDPMTGQLRRSKVMLNKYEEGFERDTMAARIMANIVNKMDRGWNRWVDNPSTRGDLDVVKVMGRYLKDIEIKAKKGTHKKKTGYDYRSHCMVFLSYLRDNKLEGLKMYQFNLSLMTDFLDYLLIERDLSPKTRNSYRTWLSHMSTWLVERQYLASNDVGKIKVLREDDKQRKPMKTEDLIKLRDYLEKNDKRMLLACLFEYYEFIRPIELVQLRLRDISVKDMTITVPASISKNRKTQVIGLNESVLKMLNELGYFFYPNHCFVFGKELRPAEEQASSAIFRNRWAKISKALRFPESYKYYSLKDTGIIDLANTHGIVFARDQARHADISTTNKYTGGINNNASEESKHFKGKL